MVTSSTKVVTVALVTTTMMMHVAATTIGITAIAGSITGNVLVPLHSF